MQAYQVVDPDWDDLTPEIILAETPADAVRKYYTDTLLEPAPKLYAEKRSLNPGIACHGAIGETRVTQFFVTDEDGTEYSIFFE